MPTIRDDGKEKYEKDKASVWALNYDQEVPKEPL